MTYHSYQGYTWGNGNRDGVDARHNTRYHRARHNTRYHRTRHNSDCSSPYYDEHRR